MRKILTISEHYIAEQGRAYGYTAKKLARNDYAMFSGTRSKWRGMHDVYVEYVGRIPKPEDIRLYEPFNNRECLHCRSDARSFEEASAHHEAPDLMNRIVSNQKSCTSSGCHGIVHEVGDLKDATFWEGHWVWINEFVSLLS